MDLRPGKIIICMKKIFITGATGFIGQELTKRLAGEEHQVRALYRSKAKATSLLHNNIELVKGDLLDTAAIRKGLQDCEEVYHLAAYAAMWSPDPKVFERLNLEVTRQLLEAAKNAGVRKVVVTSTAGVIGPSDEQAVDESTPRKVDFFSEYERTKWLAEEFISEWESGSTQVVIVNPTRVYGPGLLSVSNGVTRMIDLYIRGKFRVLPGKGNRIGNYTFIEDVVEGHIRAMDKGRHRERYLLGGHNISYTDFFSVLSEVTGRRYRQVPLPPHLLTAVSQLMLWRATYLGIPPMITPRWADRFNNYDWAVSSQKAVQELEYKITPLQEGLKRTTEWLETR